MVKGALFTGTVFGDNMLMLGGKTALPTTRWG
jgi:hypothetical protein